MGIGLSVDSYVEFMWSYDHSKLRKKRIAHRPSSEYLLENVSNDSLKFLR
jgi:hypothetical protein